jgi:hypothetical protein
VYAVDVDKDIAAYTTKTEARAANEIAANRTKKRERELDRGVDLDIGVPLTKPIGR